MKRWAATIPFLLLIACGDDPTAPVDYLATSYVLTSANGQSLPAEVDGVSADGGTTVSEITSGQLSFSGEDEISMEFQIIARFNGGAPEPGILYTTTSYARRQNTLSIDIGGNFGDRPATLSVVAGRRTVTFDMGLGFGVLVFGEAP